MSFLDPRSHTKPQNDSLASRLFAYCLEAREGWGRGEKRKGGEERRGNEGRGGEGRERERERKRGRGGGGKEGKRSEFSTHASSFLAHDLNAGP